MHVVAECRHGVNDGNDFAVKVPGMRGGKAHPADAGHLTHGGQQFRETFFAGRIAIGVYILSQQLDLAVSALRHVGGFSQDGIRSTATLLAARVRHHAIGAELIAAFDDGDVSTMRITARCEVGFEGLVGVAVVESGYARIAGLDLHQHLGKIAIGG